MFWLQMQDEKEGDHLENVTRHQPWARYLEGDNILTKIGSDRDRGTRHVPKFRTCRDAQS